MPDLYADIAHIPTETQKLLANANVVRAGDPVMGSIRAQLFDAFTVPRGSRLLEVGSGPGDVLRELLSVTGAAEAVGLDPSPVMVGTARERHADAKGLSFVEGDGRELPFADAEFDLVLFHTTLVHVPRPDAAIAEAYRVLRPNGRLVVFEGDYTTATVAVGANDPLQVCMDHAVARMVHDPYFSRRLRAAASAAGFLTQAEAAYPYLASGNAAYFLSLIGRGADLLAAEGMVSEATATQLKAEASVRVDSGRFFGFISYTSVIATKP